MATKAEMLAKVETAIETILDGGAVQDYTINGKSIRRYSLDELIRLRDKYSTEIAMESAKRSTVVKFNDPI